MWQARHSSVIGLVRRSSGWAMCPGASSARRGASALADSTSSGANHQRPFWRATKERSRMPAPTAKSSGAPLRTSPLASPPGTLQTSVIHARGTPPASGSLSSSR